MSAGRETAVRVTGVVASLCVNGLGVALMRLASLGTEPFTCLSYSVAELLGVPLTVPMLAVSAALLVLCVAFSARRLALGRLPTWCCSACSPTCGRAFSPRRESRWTCS